MNEDEQECFAHAHQLPSMASNASFLTSGSKCERACGVEVTTVY
jgi:hypothetical protein